MKQYQVVGKCRDCLKTQQCSPVDFMRAARARCMACGGQLDRQAARATLDSHRANVVKRKSSCEACETDSVLVTDEFIQSGANGPGGWKREQLAMLGVSWPPTKGWREKVVKSNMRLSRRAANRFLSLKRVKAKPYHKEVAA